jgi:hypothetical protein
VKKLNGWILCALVAGATITPVATYAQAIPAFSGADGAAAYVSGGRGGIVYHVTKLNSAIDDPQRNDVGTIRYGLNNANFPAGVPRTIVFDVGGVFHLGRLTQAEWDPNGNGWDAQSRLTIGGTNVTLAGQTAPGAGVIFMGGGLKPQGNNNMIRNITMASGYGLTGWWKPGDPFPAAPGTGTTDASQWFPDNTVYDGMDIAGTNIMISHVSTLYATDETISMNEVANNITVQYSNISQGQNYPQWDAEGGGLTGHALGSLLEAGNSTAQAAISFHHNLYAHQKGRVPQMQSKSGSLGAFYDFRNNVFYNWFGTAGTKSGATSLNLVNNFYLVGNGGDQPIGGTNPGITTQNGGTGVLGVSSTVYRNGNLIDTNRDGDANDGVALAAGGAANPLWRSGVVTYTGITDSAAQAYNNVLNYVGARWWTRDDVIDTPDERIIHEVRTGTGKIMAWADNPWIDDPNEGAEWRALKNTPMSSRPANWDLDGDGMPGWWEELHGLDPNVADNNGDFDSDGYTNLEEYLNELAEWPAPAPILFNGTTNGRYAQITNWDVNPNATLVHNWQPSKYDTAVIDNGTVVVDAVGQHAGNVLLATNAGDNATLNITDGWLKVQDMAHGLSDGIVVIGDHNAATAELNLSGGKLTTKVLLKGDGGTFNFTGGVLSAETVGFSLVNDGGTIAPGASPGTTHVMGNLTLNSGTLEIEIGGTDPSQFDRMLVEGLATLGGTLSVKLVDLAGGSNLFTPQLGDQFAFLVAGGGTDEMFDVLDLPDLAVGLDWAFTTGGMTTFLTVVETVVGLAGDFNNDGIVDAADYTVWRNHLGEADETNIHFNGDGDDVGLSDYDVWKLNYDMSNLEGGGSLADQRPSNVPEPAPIGLILVAGLAFINTRRWKFGQFNGAREENRNNFNASEVCF